MRWRISLWEAGGARCAVWPQRRWRQPAARTPCRTSLRQAVRCHRLGTRGPAGHRTPGRTWRRRGSRVGTGDSGSRGRLKFFRRLLQPEAHVRLAVHRRRSGEALVRLVSLARTPVELAEAQRQRTPSGRATPRACLGERQRRRTAPPGARRRSDRDGSRCRPAGAGPGPHIQIDAARIGPRCWPGSTLRRAGRGAARRGPARGARHAEASLRRVVLLAPGALHAGPPADENCQRAPR